MRIKKTKLEIKQDKLIKAWKKSKKKKPKKKKVKKVNSQVSSAYNEHKRLNREFRNIVK